MAVGKNIKGITIEFQGDTTKLGRAITDADKKTRSLDNQLKQVNKALKFNPGNTELLAQKQQLLGKKVEETKSKLNALKQAQAKLDDDPAVDKTSQDYQELRREIITTESKLKHFEQQMKELNNIKFEQLGKKVQDVGNKMKSVGDTMTKYVTGPIVAAGAGSIKAFQEVDSGLDLVASKTGATGKSLQGMQDIVKNMAQEIPTDFETAGAAVGEVNTRFGLTGQALEDLSSKFVKFAQLNNTDVSTSIDTVQKAMAAYGVPASEAGNYLDVLNKVGQETGVSMDTLSSSLVTNAASLQAMGMDSTQAAFFVGQLEKSGVDASAAMTGLQKALVNGAKEGKSMGDVLAEVQGSIVNAGSDTEALAAATEIFGSKAAPKMSAALRNGSLDLQTLMTSATDASGSLEETFNNTLDPADRFQMAMNGLKVTGYEVGATVLETLAPAIEKLGNFIQGLAEKWQNLSPQTQQFILKMAGLVAIIGPALSIIGRMTIGIGGLITVLPKLISGFSGVMKAFSLLSKALLTNPWMLVAAAAIAAIVLIVKNWDTIKAFFSKLWEGIKNVASAAWEKIKAVLMAPIKAYITFVKTYLSIVKKVFTTVFTAIKNVVTNIFGKIKTAMTTPIKKAKDIIKGIIDKIKSFFNFKFKLPSIKLPHFSISPKGWQLGDLLEGSIPSLGIDWYAKGGIFKSPTVVGVGDVRGGEAAVPLDPFWKKMDKIVEAVQTGGGSDEITINVYGTAGMNVNELAQAVEQRLVRLQRQKASAK